MNGTDELRVEAPRCIRCGACRSLSPTVFEVADAAARVAQPPSAIERPLVEAARWTCPTSAIRGGREHWPPAEVGFGAAETLFAELAVAAEHVRWSLAEVDWKRLDPTLAPPPLRAVVREMALSESTTYSATQRFLEAFFDDLQLSKWISVWFYEETRHPQVLIDWLERVGDPVPAELEVRARVSTPLMHSPMGTLVTNLISEITAAHAYQRLAASSTEPLLVEIARRIAGDEARHAAAFFRFARARLAASDSDSLRRDRARALEVLAAWLGGGQATSHPVAQMLERLDQVDPEHESLDFDVTTVRSRVVRVIGRLLGLPLQRSEDVAPLLRELLTRKVSR